MIIHLKKEIGNTKANEIAIKTNSFIVEKRDFFVLISSSSLKEVPSEFREHVLDSYVFKDDMQLASREYQKETRTIQFGNVKIGGNTNNTIMIAGPCSVESESQIQASSALLKSHNLTMLRGGCYKPRTSPYSFQGLGFNGLQLLDKMRNQHGLAIITEVRDATHVHEVIEHSDIIQIGAKAMYDQGILRACAKTHKPVMIKRGFGSTLQETVQCAEFVLSGGNDNVAICERGLRTFENKTRFTLDLCGVAYLKEYTNLPVILDPSHAMGHAYGVPDLTRACMAMGVDGLIIEVHPDPSVAKSDASQQLNHDQFNALMQSLPAIGNAVGRKLV
ncbi:3-deoxy-7-phosphoheptulonate synthase [Putridiphycobacter roseus]|uniref:3-deoxy-7-phosphoheptulonate synthase n=1 Tax=Putridiphycobacter roseus TaxID=2219161 RepID=A0A2W1MXA6_9FLAO|nr:3-deoxy-7-phosphoheptulonate synthase [Putridiphycobacter roseus]PZE15994.1 3-deoxy-7-phosphoheptulonate synthase [Putridiphycobacter roseus]